MNIISALHMKKRKNLLGHIQSCSPKLNFHYWSVCIILLINGSYGYSQSDYPIDTLFLQTKFIADNNIRKIKVSIEEFSSSQESNSDKTISEWETVEKLFQNTDDLDSLYKKLKEKIPQTKSSHFYLVFDKQGRLIYDSIHESIAVSIKTYLRNATPYPVTFKVNLNIGILNISTYNTKFGNTASSLRGRALPVSSVNNIKSNDKIKVIARIKGNSDQKSGQLTYCDSIVEYYFDDKIIQEEHYSCFNENELSYFKQYLYDENNKLVFINHFARSSIDNYGLQHIYNENKLQEIKYCTGTKLQNCNRTQFLKYDKQTGRLIQKIKTGVASNSDDLAIPAIYCITYEYILD